MLPSYMDDARWRRFSLMLRAAERRDFRVRVTYSLTRQMLSEYWGILLPMEVLMGLDMPEG